MIIALHTINPILNVKFRWDDVGKIYGALPHIFIHKIIENAGRNI